MQKIINFSTIAKKLKQQNLIINIPDKFKKWFFNYNYLVVLNGYSDAFYQNPKTRRYDNKATTSQIMLLHEFDVNFANHMLRDILRIERKLNTKLAYEIINTFRLEDHCLFKKDLNTIKQKIFPNFDLVTPSHDFDRFINNLVRYCDTNIVTKRFMIKTRRKINEKWSELPLDLMCLAWSFATSFNVFVALDDSAANNVLKSFGLNKGNISGFIDFIKNILRIRNMISHSYVVFNMKIKYQSIGLNNLYKSIFGIKVNQITIYEILRMIEHFSGNQYLIRNSKCYFNHLNILPEFKQKIKLFEDNNYEEDF